jgi:hypothetical protein
MTIEAVRDLLARLSASTRAMAALGLALDERVKSTALDPATRGEIDHVLAAPGADGILDGVDAAQLKPALAEIRMTLLDGANLFAGTADGPTRRPRSCRARANSPPALLFR